MSNDLAPLAPDQVRIYPKEELPYVTPRIHLPDTMRLMEKDILKVEYPKGAAKTTEPAKPETPKVATPAAPKAPPAKTKASLLGKLLKDNKVDAKELIEWFANPKRTIEEIVIVMKGESRKTVKAAAGERINELL